MLTFYPPDERVGFIDTFLSELDPRSAKDQINERYAHGGGWCPMEGWSLDPKTFAIAYPGDPSLRPISEAKLRDEHIIVYDDAWVAIIQPDGTFEVARID